jgi:hypothetical protein
MFGHTRGHIYTYIKQITLKHLGVCHVTYTTEDYSFGTVHGIARVSNISPFLQHGNDTHSYIQSTKLSIFISYQLLMIK